MRFSIFQMPHCFDPRKDAATIEKSLQQAELADTLGFDGVWISEHHFTGTSVFGDPMVYAAAVASRTRRVAIGFGVLQLALHHPVRLASQISLLDQISHGRIQVGVARGSAFNDWEYRGFGLTIDDGRDRFAESLEVLLRCWTDGEFSHRGRHYDLDVPGIRPAPVQLPHPPIYRSALTPESVAQIGREGYRLMLPRLTGPVIRERLAVYEDGLRAAGHPENLVADRIRDVSFLKNVYVAPTDEEALADIAEPSRRQAAGQAASRAKYRAKLAAAGLEFSDGQNDDRFRETMARGLIAGSAATVANELRDLRSHGVHHVIATIDWGDMEDSLVERSMRLIADEVLPAL